jgi:hypothetical protein
MYWIELIQCKVRRRRATWPPQAQLLTRRRCTTESLHADRHGSREGIECEPKGLILVPEACRADMRSTLGRSRSRAREQVVNGVAPVKPLVSLRAKACKCPGGHEESKNSLGPVVAGIPGSEPREWLLT